MKFQMQQGLTEFGRVPQLPPSWSQRHNTAGSGTKAGAAVASFCGALVKTSGQGWVSGGTLQDAEHGSSISSSTQGGGRERGAAAVAASAAPSAAAVEAKVPSYAGLGSMAAHAELEAEQCQMQYDQQYDQPAGPLLRGEQCTATGASEQQPPSGEQQQQKRRQGAREGVRYSIARSNVGYRLLKKAGWTEGAGLGAQEQGVAEPVAAFQQEGNLGLGFAPRPKLQQPGAAAVAVGARGGGGAAAAQQQQPQQQVQQPKRPLPADPLEKEDTDAKVKRVRQVMQAEADDKAGKAIARYIHMAFSDTTGEPTRDSNPLLRRNHRLSATNPLL